MMHPLAPDLSGLSNDELLKKYNDLCQKLSIAYRTGSGSVVGQISMLLENYKEELRIRQEKMLADANKNPNFKNIIDIK
jgi:hypothetical protein